MNEFSILCRVLGSLYYRQPQDPLLVPLFTLIREGKLAASWPLEQDELLARLQKSCEMQSTATDYNALFVGEACSVPPYRSAWVEGSSEAEVRAFLSEHGIPTGRSGGSSRLAAAGRLPAGGSCRRRPERDAGALFADYILPWCGTMLGKVEAHAHTPFWRTMAPLTRDAIAAMWDELQEEDEQ